tara:strand:+ start:86 stop:520 length:435 start_codon:yes stop_codon:yes gene_type:complete
MPTTGIVNGTDLFVSVDNTAGGTGTSFVKITYATSASISFNMETREASNKDSQGFKQVLEGQQSVTIDTEGMTALDASFGYEEIYALWTNRVLCNLEFGTSVTGDTVYQVKGYLTSLSISAGVEDTSTFSASFECTGSVTTATA